MERADRVAKQPINSYVMIEEEEAMIEEEMVSDDEETKPVTKHAKRAPKSMDTADSG